MKPDLIRAEARRFRELWPDGSAEQQRTWKRAIRGLADALEAVRLLDRDALWETLDEPSKQALPALLLLLDMAHRQARRCARSSRKYCNELWESFVIDVARYRGDKG
jgi:hypothetical protein